MKLFISFLEKLSCKHQWELYHKQINHWSIEDGGGIKEIRHTLICNNCGKIKRIKV